MKGILWLPFIVLFDSASAQNIDAVISHLSDDRKISDTIFHFSKRYLMRGKNDSAEYWLDRGLVYAKKTNDPARIANYHIDKSNIAFNKGHTQKSFAALHQASVYLDKTESYDVHNKYLLILAKCYRADFKYDSALYYYERCEKLNQARNPYRNWLVYLDMAMMFAEADARVNAEKYFTKAYDITKEKGIRMDHGVVISQFADYCQANNFPAKFAHLLKEYQEFAGSAKIDFSKDPVHSLIYIDWGNKTLEKKVAFLADVKNDLVNRGDLVNAAVTNSYIYLLYEKNKQFDEALKYIDESLHMVSSINYLTHSYIYTKAKYRVLKEAGRTKEATAVADRLFTLKDSIIAIQNRELAISLEKKYESEKKEKEIALLTSQHELSRYELKAEMEKGEALLRENKLKEEKLAKELLLRKALEREKNLTDSTLAQQERLTLALQREGLLRNSELQKANLLGSALARENRLKQESLDKDKKNNRRLWAGIGLLSVSGLVILWQFNRQVKKNSIIKKQADGMEILNREIHHRVKNNLQVISSLLDIQSQTIKDPEAADVIKESRQRVQSMAIIHQNLYEGNAVQEISISNYVNDLADHLFSSYNIRKDRIHFMTDIDQINLHTDTVIPVGMILNELISNSLKYAFRDMEQGLIKVSMKQKDNELLLNVTDNGIGLPAGFDINKLHSFGYKVIKAFAQKLKARLLIDGQHGTNISLVISKFKTI